MLESPAASARVVYPAKFYRSFQPQTALDMLERTPGLVIDYGDDGGDLRGFGAGAGNVLIDGKRPTVKSGGLAPVLRRIAAARVDRIEILRGAQIGEAQGQSLIANVILHTAAQGSGNAAFELRRAPWDEIVTSNAELSYALRRGSWDLSAGVTGYFERNPFRGRYTWQEGETVETASEAFDENELAGTLTGSATGPLAGGTLGINLQLEYEKEAYVQQLVPGAGGGVESRTEGEAKERGGELGLDWTRGLGAQWSLKTVALARVGAVDFAESLDADDREHLDQQERTQEWVARATLRREGELWFRPELSGELAWNTLESRLRLTENGVPVDLAGQDAAVSELRGEVVASASAQLAAPLRVEAALAYERSRIEVSGDSLSARSLDFWKPSAAVVWTLGVASSLRVGWKRTVGQLDFEAFAASADLIDDRPIGGNAELRPELTEAWSASLDHRFGTGGAVTVTADRERIADALAFVPLASGGEALVNFGTVKLWRLSSEATLPLDVLTQGAQIAFSGSAVWARRIDPVTAQMRNDSRASAYAEVSFRHDVSAWNMAYGATAEFNSAEREWYLDEIFEERYHPYASAFVESSAILPGFKTTLTIYGLFGQHERRQRRFFTPDRSGELAGSEQRERKRGSYINLLIARAF